MKYLLVLLFWLGMVSPAAAQLYVCDGELTSAPEQGRNCVLFGSASHPAKSGDAPAPVPAKKAQQKKILPEKVDITGINARARDKHGQTTLMWAARWNTAIIPALLNAGADVKARNVHGQTALMHAARWSGNPKTIRVLLDAGAEIETRDKLAGQTALMYAAAGNKNPAVMRALLDAGADVNAHSNERGTALIYAARWNENAEIIRLLLNAGADVNAYSREGGTALMYAARWNENPEIIRALLNAGANPESHVIRGNTDSIMQESLNKKLNDIAKANAVLFLSLNNSDTLLDSLMSCDEIERENIGDRAVIADSAIRDLWLSGPSVPSTPPVGLWDKAEAALLFGPDLKAKSLDRHIAQKAIVRISEGTDNHLIPFVLDNAGYGNILNMLWRPGLYYDASATSLMIAVQFNNNPEIIRALADAGATIDVRNNQGDGVTDGLTPLMFAVCQNDKHDTIRALLNAGADVNARSNNLRSPLMFAAQYAEKSEIINVLLNAGAKINAHNENGDTPLTIAARWSRKSEIIIALLDAGADVKAKNKDGKTAWNYIQDNIYLKQSDAYWVLRDLFD